jgi:hypothetical protein
MSIGKWLTFPERRKLAWGLDAHRRYFARQAAREGFELDDREEAAVELANIPDTRELRTSASLVLARHLVSLIAHP